MAFISLSKQYVLPSDLQRLGLQETATPDGGTAYTDSSGTLYTFQSGTGFQSVPSRIQQQYVPISSSQPPASSGGGTPSTPSPAQGQYNSDESQFYRTAKHPDGSTYTYLDAAAAQAAINDPNNPYDPYGTKARQAQSQPQGTQGSDSLLSQLESFIQTMYSRGNTLNPNIQITPEITAQFMAMAQNEVEPFYASQLKVAREGFLSALGYSENEILQREQGYQTKYGRELRQLGESAAERGFAQSGIRRMQEGELATDTQREIDEGRRQLGFQATNLARNFATQYGGGGIPSSTIENAPRVLSGESQFQSPRGESLVYQLSPDVYQGLVGEKQKEKATGIRGLEQFYEGLYRQGQTIPQIRSLSL